MTLYDLQPGFEEDMGLLKASANWDMDRNLNYDNKNMNNQNPGTVNVGNQVLAMAYVPYQEFTDYFTSYTDALDNGSLFKNLVKPFTGRRIGKR